MIEQPVDGFNGLTTAGAATIRIAFCITELDYGGAERALVELATRIDRARFTPRVFCLAGEPTPQRPSLTAALRAAGVEVHCLGGRGPRDALAVYWRLTRALRESRPDLVQTFLFHANLLGRFAARRAGVPRVVSGIRVAERRSRWRLAADRWTAGLVDRHVCVSQAVADFACQHGGLPRSSLVVIPNGIDPAQFDVVAPANLSDLGLPAGRRAVTFVGRLDPQKGLDWLLRGARRWLDLLPEHDLLVVGEGPLRGDLESLAGAAGIAGRVHFAGWRDDVPAILRASDLLVLPSRWEGMPNVVLEAMASSRPVVACDVEGVRELLGPAGDAQIDPPLDEQAWAERVAAVAGDRKLASELGAANRQRAVDHFSLSATVRAYEALYESLIKKGDATRSL